MKTTLVIMAAGIGSRYGGGIKQLAAVGPNGEILMDYSIHDAIAAGFNKIIFIIRHDIEEAFREVIGNRIEKICADLGVEVAYAYQALDDLPDNATLPEGRSKPWGTGQAVLWPAVTSCTNRLPSSTLMTITASRPMCCCMISWSSMTRPIRKSCAWLVLC